MFEEPINRRTKQAVMTTGANGIASIIKLITLIAITPFLINYLGTAKYGLVMTILSICLWVNTIADAGIVNSLKNEIIKDYAINGLTDNIKSLNSTTFFFA